MSSRTVQLMIFAIILGSASLYLTSRSDYTAPLETPVAIASLGQLDINQVARIEMTKGDSSVLLVRVNQGWSLPSAWDSPGDRTEIAKLLDDIRSISAPEKRASSSSNHSSFQVGSDAGLRIALQDATGASLGDLVLGKRDGTGRTFIRIFGEDEVYSVTPNLLFRAGFSGSSLDAGKWSDKSLYQLPASAEVQSLTMTSPQGLVRLQRQEPDTSDPAEDAATDTAPSQWTIVEPEPGPADRATVTGILSALKNVQAAEPADPSDLTLLGLEPPTSFIEGELEDGSTFLIQFGLETELTGGGQGFYARVVGQRRVAVVRNWVRESLLKNHETLRATPPEPEPEPEPEPKPEPESTPEAAEELPADSDG
ncbi:MAG: DUF4340 domain-containing protein [Planctomycetota bacterium]|nr:DUF4340 domain-containing protein [Planctomycetota bacterium]